MISWILVETFIKISTLSFPDLMSCDGKTLVVRLMCISIYWLHATVIRRDISRGKMITKIIFILFVNLRMDSSANILLAYKEKLDYLENKLVYQTQADHGTEKILKEVNNSGQKQL